MELMEAIAGRRSVRKFKNDEIPLEDLHGIMDAAIMAPSAKNLQPWHLVMIHSEESIAKFRSIIKGSLFYQKSVREELSKRFANNPEVVDETMEFLGDMGGAPAVLLAFEYKPDYPEEWNIDVIESVAAALQNALLAAYDKGIASCWANAPLSFSDELREAFAPEHGRMLAAVAFGYRDEEIRREIRRKDGRVAFC